MYNILLVEDDKNIREMLVEYFSKRDKEKFNITLAENGLKGLVRHNLLTVGNVSLNPNNGVVVSDGEEVTLTAKEYAILKILLENKNSVVSREKIITAVWHYDTMIDERVLDTHIKNIRKALGENASVLKTVIRRGYKAEDKK